MGNGVLGVVVAKLDRVGQNIHLQGTASHHEQSSSLPLAAARLTLTNKRRGSPVPKPGSLTSASRRRSYLPDSDRLAHLTTSPAYSYPTATLPIAGALPTLTGVPTETPSKLFVSLRGVSNFETNL